MSLTILVGGAITVIGMMCKTAKQMHENHLITQKELAEIEAKSKAFEQYVKYHQNTVDKAYELEKELLGFANRNLEFAKSLMEKIMVLDERSKKIEMLHIEICRLIDANTAILLNNPKYFNETLFRNNKISSIDFHNSTDIGKNESPIQQENYLIEQR